MSKELGTNDAVSKALRTLLILTAHDSLRVSDLARELNVAVSTAHRMLHIMSLHGFVEQEEGSRRYRLGSAALDIGRRPAGRELAPTAHPHLARLSAELGETVNLLVLDGADAVFLDGVESRQPVRVATRTGSRVPAYESAGGKALLAQLPFAAVRTMYAGGLSRATRYTLPDLAGLERDLERTRERGYALNLGEHVAEIRAIGIAVRGPRGAPIAALTAAGPSSRWQSERLVTLLPRLRETAAAIERDLRRPADGANSEQHSQ
ncbi:MAG TPA: IclR family transcriptional regulator [Actinospica sp.]|jgi:DNA-binding IclR family transcriptional regulator|nr:IclR family transcriptional regulator [Actinospica sp.]